MTQRFAVLDEDGLVLNVVMAETAEEAIRVDPPEDPSQPHAPVGVEAIALDEGAFVGPGWARDGHGWSAPAAELPAPLTLDQRREQRRTEVNARRDAVLGAGYQHNFGGSAGIRTLDNRDERDAINWLGLGAIVERLIAGDQGSTQIAIRDAADDTFTASAQTVSNALFAMAGWRSAVLANSWTLKDQIAAAADEDALAAVDLDAGWPG